MNFVFVIVDSSSKREQKRVTLASSNGASTSSRTQIGEGLVKKIANTNDKAVNACSPPDNKVIDCNLLPGGETNISNPASRGSSESTSSSLALPPLNSFTYTSLNFLLILENASKSLSRPF